MGHGGRRRRKRGGGGGGVSCSGVWKVWKYSEEFNFRGYVCRPKVMWWDWENDINGVCVFMRNSVLVCLRVCVCDRIGDILRVTIHLTHLSTISLLLTHSENSPLGLFTLKYAHTVHRANTYLHTHINKHTHHIYHLKTHFSSYSTTFLQTHHPAP